MSKTTIRLVGQRPKNTTKVPHRLMAENTPLTADQAGSPVVGTEQGDDGRYEFTVQHGLRPRGTKGPAVSWGSIGPIDPPEPGHPDGPAKIEPLHKLTIQDVARAKKPLTPRSSSD